MGDDRAEFPTSTSEFDANKALVQPSLRGAPWLGPPTVDYAALLGRERKRLLELLGTVNPVPDWSRQTPCPAWDVADLCRHLLGDDLHLLSTVRDDHQGTEPPTDIDEPSFIDWLDGVQEAWVQASRRISPQLVVDLLRWTGPQITETFRRTDPGAVTQIVSWAADSPVPMWLDMGSRDPSDLIDPRFVRRSGATPTSARTSSGRCSTHCAGPTRISAPQLVQQPGDAGQAG